VNPGFHLFVKMESLVAGKSQNQNLAVRLMV
jgi:hypothetical protein